MEEFRAGVAHLQMVVPTSDVRDAVDAFPDLCVYGTADSVPPEQRPRGEGPASVNPRSRAYFFCAAAGA